MHALLLLYAIVWLCVYVNMLYELGNVSEQQILRFVFYMFSQLTVWVYVCVCVCVWVMCVGGRLIPNTSPRVCQCVHMESTLWMIAGRNSLVFDFSNCFQHWIPSSVKAVWRLEQSPIQSIHPMKKLTQSYDRIKVFISYEDPVVELLFGFSRCFLDVSYVPLRMNRIIHTEKRESHCGRAT